MNRSRRLVSLLAAFAVLATAMWPLLGALHDSASGEVTPLCHQAGMQVSADSMPMPDSQGDGNAPKSHCPLCVLVFFASFAPTVAAPPYVAVAMAVARERDPAPLARRFTVVLPGSRAPPGAFA